MKNRGGAKQTIRTKPPFETRAGESCGQTTIVKRAPVEVAEINAASDVVTPPGQAAPRL